ncbi:MAG: hypothetical protein M3081_09455 [Gemmatimonadota bacterium]|nr:hypothetical protein [Gemmatimonadota bacterium]
MRIHYLALAALAVVSGGATVPLSAQIFSPRAPAHSSHSYDGDDDLRMSGPRIGATLLTGWEADSLRQAKGIHPVIAQIGWQIERNITTTKDGPIILTELVGLIGGFDQNVVVPSGSWLLGVRLRNGAEFGAGANVSVGGSAAVLAAGVSPTFGSIRIPISVGVVPARSGTRITVLTGFIRR